MAWFRHAVEAPMLSRAACSFREKESIGTFRETGRTATVFRLELLAPSSEGLLRPCAV